MNTLPSTDNYSIGVVADPEHDGVDCYAVINKHTQVREYYDNLISRTYQAMVSMEEKYQEMESHQLGETQLDLAVNNVSDITNH